ncbi:MAG: AraC-like DNA-binding protein [Halioglobus sp.]|jgi:AraC-like DNA-binding protein
MAKPRTARIFDISLPGKCGTDFSKAIPALEDVAERMFTTSTTVHRRLREESNSFQKLKYNRRRDAAIHMLRDEAINGKAIADQLGFSDPSTFFRAFKKWTGLTPTQF